MKTRSNLRNAPRAPLVARLSLVVVCGLSLTAPSRASEAVFTFDVPPDPADAAAGLFDYQASNGVTATFAGFQHDDSGMFPERAGALFGALVGEPLVVSFSSPVQLVELYVNNLQGDFDFRHQNPSDYKLFSITGELNGVNVFLYDHAGETDPGSGTSSLEFFRIAPPAGTGAVTSLTFINFDLDALDDLTVAVPEPATASLFGIAAGLLARRGRRRTRCGRVAPPLERDPPRRREASAIRLRSPAEFPARHSQEFHRRTITASPRSGMPR